jgi:hypothetical protein
VIGAHEPDLCVAIAASPDDAQAGVKIEPVLEVQIIGRAVLPVDRILPVVPVKVELQRHLG